MDLEHVDYTVDGRVAVITLDRSDRANAQNERALQELDDAWRRAEADREVRVIVLRSAGRHFSAGHDLTEGLPASVDREIPLPDAIYDWEDRHYFHYAKRWREVPKPSIAAVQGKCIAAGLMLCWPCDLIVAADDAEFSDSVIHMGVGGVEFQAHAFEFGARKAKELLFTGASITAEEAQAIGMVNRVVPRDELVAATMELAHRIAEQDPFALRMAKRSVNRAVDLMGFSAAIEHGFDLHHFAHTRANAILGDEHLAIADLDALKARNDRG